MSIVAASVALLVAGGPAGGGPKRSADVVEMKLVFHTLADGLACYFVDLKVADGWQVYANTGGRTNERGRAKPPADACVVEFRAGGKPVATHSIHYPEGKARTDAAGRRYRVYEGTVPFTAWLSADEARGGVSVRVRVVATDGKARLAESVVTAHEQ